MSYQEKKNVLTFSTSVSKDVQQDVIAITFQETIEGLNSNNVQAALIQPLQEALSLAKAIADGDLVSVSTGEFSVSPKYNNLGSIIGFLGKAEMIVSGTNVEAISNLAIAITSMTVESVAHSTSRNLRESTEAEICTAAIESFKSKADHYTTTFGLTVYTVCEATISVNVNYPPGPYMTSAYSSIASLPIEGGTDTITVTVNGSVQMA